MNNLLAISKKPALLVKHKQGQPRSHGLSSYRPMQEEERPWERGWNKEV